MEFAKKFLNQSKKRRNNYKLRRLVAPKMPLMVLNELVGTTEPVEFQFADPVQLPGVGQLHTAQALVLGDIYSGTGPSKTIAKNICADKAIPAVIAKKIYEKKEKEEELENKPTNEVNTPWASLASLALFKMFSDWQAKGYTLPEDLVKQPQLATLEDKIDVLLNSAKEENPDKEIPTKPVEKHPRQLLNELNGAAIEYQLTEQSGESPQDFVFTMSCVVKENTYTGKGRNKKEAKTEAARMALKNEYDISYPSA